MSKSNNIQLKLQHYQLLAVHDFLKTVIIKCQTDNLYIEMQIIILGKLLEKKIMPKTIFNKGEVKLSLKRTEVIAFQLAYRNGWTQWCENESVQMIIYTIVMLMLPPMNQEQQTLAPAQQA